MGGDENEVLDPDHNALPFRLSDIEIKPQFFDFHPVILTVRKELVFQWKLIRHEWNKQHLITLLAGVIAIILGTFNGEILNGGDAQISGLEGLQQSGATSYFQMILSIVCWGWFLYQLLRMFPIMRTHSVTLMLIWGGLGLSQILFHVENKEFPISFDLSQMMGGLLVTLVCIFFLYFFIKAVTETRDLHVETNHLHEDVRMMEAEMAEHSLKAWTTICFTWCGVAIVSSWSGAHFVAERMADQTLLLALYVVLSILCIPLLMWTIWFPQRMLGIEALVRTKAAVSAEEDLRSKEISPKVAPDEEAW
jgi:TRAP-type C4-dicarboxylate transport system permease small subunit